MEPRSILTQIASLLSNCLTESDNSQEKNSERAINPEVSGEREREREREGNVVVGNETEKGKERGREGESKLVYFMHLQGTVWELSETWGHPIVCFQNGCGDRPLLPGIIK